MTRSSSARNNLNNGVISQQQFQQAGGFQQVFAPLPPALPNWNNRSITQSTNLRTRDWSNSQWGGQSTGTPQYYPPASFVGSSSYNAALQPQNQNFGTIGGLQNNQSWSTNNQSWNNTTSYGSNIPQAPPAPSWGAQRQWTRGPYVQPSIRTRNWGDTTDNGWTNFNSGIYSQQSTLPFNSNSFISQPVSVAPVPVANGGTGLKNPSIFKGGRNGRRAAKKQAKRDAIAAKLQSGLNPPVGDPAVNHYRRGVHVTVPVVGPTLGGVAPSTGSIRSRRTGRRNNLGRRNNRTAAPALPVPLTQPPFVQPVAVPVAPAFYPATYRTVYSNPSIAQNYHYTAQPVTGFHAPIQTVPIAATQHRPIYSVAPFTKVAPTVVYDSQGNALSAGTF